MKSAHLDQSVAVAYATAGLNDEERSDFGAATAEASSYLGTRGFTLKAELAHFSFTSADLQSLSDQAENLHVLVVAPRLRTWSRLNALNSRGPPPLRSREALLGCPWNSSEQQQQCDGENADLATTLKILNKFMSAQSAARLPLLYFLSAEDLGRTNRFTPASVWQLAGLRQLAREYGLLRSALYQCHLAETVDAQHSRPTGILHNARLPRRTHRRGWPRFDAAQSYIGPLAPKCNCGVKHDSMVKSEGQYRTPARLIEQGTIRMLAFTAATNLAHDWAKRSGLLTEGGSDFVFQALHSPRIQDDSKEHDEDLTDLEDAADADLPTSNDLSHYTDGQAQAREPTAAQHLPENENTGLGPRAGEAPTKRSQRTQQLPETGGGCSKHPSLRLSRGVVNRPRCYSESEPADSPLSKPRSHRGKSGAVSRLPSRDARSISAAPYVVNVGEARWRSYRPVCPRRSYRRGCPRVSFAGRALGCS